MLKYFLCLALLLSANNFSFAELSEEEKTTSFGEWDFRVGIWKDQWEFYSEQWKEQNNISDEIVPDGWSWRDFADANSGGGNGTSALFNSYRNFVDMQAIQYLEANSPSMPIDAHLRYLVFFGIMAGWFLLRKGR